MDLVISNQGLRCLLRCLAQQKERVALETWFTDNEISN
jgi:hypothetical protein